MKSYDALVIGAGPSGATAALVLARAGWSVAIVEKARFPRRKVCGEFISAASITLLHKLGVAAPFLALAGPDIRRVGLYAGRTMLAADMPRPLDAAEQYGRALGRQHLDTLLLAQAAKAGAEVIQPCAGTQVQMNDDGFVCTVSARDAGERCHGAHPANCVHEPAVASLPSSAILPSNLPSPSIPLPGSYALPSPSERRDGESVARGAQPRASWRFLPEEDGSEVLPSPPGRGIEGEGRLTGSRTLRARIIIAAHGSWEPGALPTQTLRSTRRASDLLAFKAHFLNCSLAPDLMPLLVFRGGYGGLVHTDSGRTSLSCCIRRDTLARCRIDSRHRNAAAAVLAHILADSEGAAAALEHAQLDGSWLSAGPIRPGIRPFRHDGIFCVGNAAGEAHPIVAEGIGMAIQSAWLLCEQLTARRDAVMSRHGIEAIARDYAASWKLNFATRIHAAAAFAHLAMRPLTAQLALAIIKRVPAVLTLGAYLSGKAQRLKSCSPP